VVPMCSSHRPPALPLRCARCCVCLQPEALDAGAEAAWAGDTVDMASGSPSPLFLCSDSTAVHAEGREAEELGLRAITLGDMVGVTVGSWQIGSSIPINGLLAAVSSPASVKVHATGPKSAASMPIPLPAAGKETGNEDEAEPPLKRSRSETGVTALDGVLSARSMQVIPREHIVPPLCMPAVLSPYAAELQLRRAMARVGRRNQLLREMLTDGGASAALAAASLETQLPGVGEAAVTA